MNLKNKMAPHKTTYSIIVTGEYQHYMTFFPLFLNKNFWPRLLIPKTDLNDPLVKEKKIVFCKLNNNIISKKFIVQTPKIIFPSELR